MSYEGHEQVVCKNGHYYRRAASYNIFSEDGEKCPSCQATDGWHNNVDDTNCDSYGEIPFELFEARFLVSKAVGKMCDMGHYHELTPAVYRVPTREETRHMRHYRPDYGGTPLIPLNETL